MYLILELKYDGNIILLVKEKEYEQDLAELKEKLSRPGWMQLNAFLKVRENGSLLHTVIFIVKIFSSVSIKLMMKFTLKHNHIIIIYVVLSTYHFAGCY